MMKPDPQPVSTLRERFQDALAEVFDIESIRLGVGVRPSDCRKCVFDFPDGLRLIVSKERMPDGALFRHFSASAHPGTTFYRWLAKQRKLNRALKIIKHRYRELSGDEREAEFVGLSENKGVPHWYIWE